MQGACFGRLALVVALGVTAVPNSPAQAAEPIIDAALLASNGDYSAAVGMPVLGPEDDGALPLPAGLSSTARLATQDGTIFSIELNTSADAESAAALYEQLRELYAPTGFPFELGDQSSATAEGAVVQLGAQVLVVTLGGSGTGGPPPPGGVAPIAATAVEGMTGSGLAESGVRVPAGASDPCSTPTDLVEAAFPGATSAWWRAERPPALECQFTTASGPVHVSVVSDTQLAASVAPRTVDELFDADLGTSVSGGDAQELSGVGDRAFSTTQPNLMVEAVAPDAAGTRHLIRAVVPVPFAGPASEQDMLASMQQLVIATHSGLDLPDAVLPPVTFAAATPPPTTAADAATTISSSETTPAAAATTVAAEAGTTSAPASAPATSVAATATSVAAAATSGAASTDNGSDSWIIWLLVAVGVLVIAGLVAWWVRRRRRARRAPIVRAPVYVAPRVAVLPPPVPPRARGVTDAGAQTLLRSGGGLGLGVRVGGEPCTAGWLPVQLLVPPIRTETSMTTALEPPTTTAATRLTARDVVFTDPADAATAIQQAIEERNLLRKLPQEVPALNDDAARFVAGEVVRAIDGILGDLDVDDLLAAAWGQVDEVRTAVQTTAADHGARYLTLDRHEFASEHSPRVELLVNEVPVPLLDLRLRLRFSVDGCDLVVRDGKIDGARVGGLLAEGELTTTVTLLRHELGAVDPTRLFAAPPVVG